MKKLLLALALSAPLFTLAQSKFWTSVPETEITLSGPRVIVPQKYKTVHLEGNLLRDRLFNAPSEYSTEINRSSTIIDLPMPDGSFQRFAVVEASIMEKELAAQFPFIKTFSVAGIDVPGTYGKLDYTDFGFHGMVRTPSGDFFIDPYCRNNTTDYITYRTADFVKDPSQILPEIGIIDANGQINKSFSGGVNPLLLPQVCAGTSLRTYRLAIACTGEYAVAATGFASPTTAQILSVVVTTVNRVDGVYETEVAVRMVLVSNETTILYGNANTDPFAGNNNANTLINESQTVITSNIGTANFDIGHTFSTGGGGLAGLGVVCNSSQKARGITGSSNPVGDPYDIDYVAHEIGHEFSGNHTFASPSGSCGGNQNPGTMVEPGSGVTIMAYAGICSPDDLDPHSIAYFHTISFDEIMNFTNTGGGNSCPVTVATTNHAPVVTGSGNYSIPKSTPFTLTGSATDADGDPLTYQWEEIDNNSTANSLGSGSAPFFRSYAPVTSPSRIFPLLATVLAGATSDLGDYLPATAQTLNFRLTARDNKMGGGGVCYAASVITVASSGPFTVSYPNTTGITWASNSTQTVTWNVNSTNTAPVSCANVNILLSIDGGNTFTTLLANTPNDGTQSITVPSEAVTINTCRIKVEAVGNVFFDISDNNFTITATTGPVIPTASFTSNLTSVCMGGSISFTDQSAGLPTAWSWSFPGGTPSTATSQNPTVVYNTAGTYTVTLTASNLVGSNTSTVTNYVTVNASVAPAVSISTPNATICAGASTTFTATPSNGGSVPSYQWAVNGSNAGTNSSTFTTSTLTNGQIVTCVMTSNASCVSPSTATSTGITITISASSTPSVAVAVSSGTNPSCNGSSVTFTATPTNAVSPSYQWKLNGTNVGTNNTTYTNAALANNDVVTCVMSASSSCPSSIVLGTSTTANATNSDVGAAYPTYYGNGRQQYLIRASELTAIGLTAGNIGSLGFYVTGSAGNPSTLNGYSIKLATTTANTLTNTFQAPTFTTVFGPVNYTPTLNALNTHTLSTPFNWNGTSNLLIDICFANSVNGTLAYQTYQTASTFVSTTYYQADNATGANACSRTTGTNTGSIRPNITFGTGPIASTSNAITMTINALPTVTATSTANTVCAGTAVTLSGGGASTYTWSGGVTNGVPFTPTGTTTYTVTGTSAAGCSGTATKTITVNTSPTVVANATATAICYGTSVTLSGGGATSYVWSGGVSNGVAFTPTTTTTYTVTGTAANGCTATATKTISVDAIPTVTVNATATNICAGTAVTLSGLGATNYSWSGGVMNAVAFTPTATTTYTVTGSTVNGCTGTATQTITVNPALSISVSATATAVCAGTSVTLSGNGASSYTWTGGVTNGIPFTPTGTTTYTVTGSNGTGCNGTATQTITVNAAPSVSITASSNSVCMGSSVILSGNGASNYSWSSGVQNAIAFTPTTTATYTVTGTNGNGCSASATTTVVLNNLPTVSISSTANVVCAGVAITLTANGANNYIFTGGITSGISFIPSATTTYTVTGTDGNGCTNSATKTITVNPLPVLGIIPTSTSVCPGGSVTLSGTGANTYSWSGGITNGLQFTPTTSSSYTLTGTDNNGCTNSYIQQVTLYPLPTVTANASSNLICAGDNLVLTGGGASTYVWNNGINNGVAFVPTGTATYTVSGTDANGCTNTSVTTVVLIPLPIATTTTVGATIVADLANASYQWLNCNSGSTPITGETNQSFTATSNGNYAVMVISSGCANTSGCVNISTVGISEEFNSVSYHVYPNPINSNFTIEMNGLQDQQMLIEIFDALGKKVIAEQRTVNSTNSSISINTEYLSSGIYFLRLMNNSQELVYKVKLLKE